MAVTAAMVKELRQKTGAGMLDCKKALTEKNGDIEAAVDFLREKGLAKAAKKKLVVLQQKVSLHLTSTVVAVLVF